MATYPLKNISIGGDTYKIPIPPVYVIKCSDSVAETSWTDWQAGGRTLATPTLYKDGVQINDWSELTPDCNVSFELTADGGTNNKSFKLSEVSFNPGYGSSSYQFEYIGSEAGSLPDSFAYIVRLGFFDGNMTSKKGYRVPLIAQGGGGGGGSVTTYYLYNEWGSSATFAAMTTANNCVLKDSSSINVNISTLATAFAAGTVYIEDADGAKTRVLSLGYNSGSVRYFYMLMPSSTASAKLRSCDWSSNKYYMTNVNL